MRGRDLTDQVLVGVLQAAAVYALIWAVANLLVEDRQPARWHALMVGSYTVAHHAGRLGMWAETRYRDAIA